MENVIWKNSSAIFFDRLRDAVDCERMLHWLFRKNRLPSCFGDGGTEFFSLDCLRHVEDFIREHRIAIGFREMKRGLELFS